MAMTLVSTVTVGAGGAASIEFTNIPQTGKDLLVLFSGRQTEDVAEVFFRINSSTTNYTRRFLRNQDSTTVNSGTATNFAIYSVSSVFTANTFSNGAIYISNYTSNVAKSISVDSVQENNATNASSYIYAGLWDNTAAVTGVSFVRASTDNIAQHSTASLYIIS